MIEQVHFLFLYSNQNWDEINIFIFGCNGTNITQVKNILSPITIVSGVKTTLLTVGLKNSDIKFSLNLHIRFFGRCSSAV